MRKYFGNKFRLCCSTRETGGGGKYPKVDPFGLITYNILKIATRYGIFFQLNQIIIFQNLMGFLAPSVST